MTGWRIDGARFRGYFARGWFIRIDQSPGCASDSVSSDRTVASESMDGRQTINITIELWYLFRKLWRSGLSSASDRLLPTPIL